MGRSLKEVGGTMNNPLFKNMKVTARQTIILDRGARLNGPALPNGGYKTNFSPLLIPQWADYEGVLWKI